MDKKKSKCVFFLGAGFSKDAGIPLQRELLPEYLKSEDKQILKFLSDVYSFNYHPNNDINIYPKLEDIFSAIDTAIINDEYLKEYRPDKLREIREKLVCGIIDLIDKSKRNSDYIEKFAKVLTDFRLNSENDDPFAIITTNWDIVLLNRFREYHSELIEDVFSNHQNLRKVKVENRRKIALIDYCLYTHPLIDEKNHIPSLKIKAMGYKNIKLLYLHGSPTWLYCKKCKKIFSPPSYGKSTKVALKNMLEPKQCPKCHTNSTLSHVLIMPTYYKIIQNVHLLDVWQNAAMELQEATTVFFIGYSLPEADYLIRNLLVSNINEGANIYISSRSGSDSDTKKNCSGTVNNYRQLFGRRIKDDNIRKGTGKKVIMDICKQIKDGKFEGF